MPRRLATESGLEPHWKIRVALPGSLVHLASSTEPRWVYSIGVLEWTPIEGADYGDTVGIIRWDQAIAVTWRYSP